MSSFRLPSTGVCILSNALELKGLNPSKHMTIYLRANVVRSYHAEAKFVSVVSNYIRFW